MAKIVETAQFRPGHCVLSKETQGPFIDTGQTVPRYGRVYISLKWLAEPLRELNYLSPGEAEEIIDTNQALQERVNELEGTEEDLKALVEAIKPHLDLPKPEVQKVQVIQHRKPTDEEIEAWVAKNGGNHPAVVHARSPEPGSYEEWAGLYGPSGPERKAQPKTVDNEAEEVEPQTDDGPEKIVVVHDQEVDLDVVLDQNVGDILSFAEGKGDEFAEALVDRELWRAAEKEKSPRSSLVEGLGFTLEEDA